MTVDDLKAELQLTQTKLRIARERHSADMAKSHVETFERTKERDEARAECTRLREALKSVADGDGIYVGRDEMGLFCAACGKRGLGNDHFDSCPVTVARAALAFDATTTKGE